MSFLTPTIPFLCHHLLRLPIPLSLNGRFLVMHFKCFLSNCIPIWLVIVNVCFWRRFQIRAFQIPVQATCNASCSTDLRATPVAVHWDTMALRVALWLTCARQNHAAPVESATVWLPSMLASATADMSGQIAKRKSHSEVWYCAWIPGVMSSIEAIFSCIKRIFGYTYRPLYELKMSCNYLACCIILFSVLFRI